MYICITFRIAWLLQFSFAGFGYLWLHTVALQFIFQGIYSLPECAVQEFYGRGRQRNTNVTYTSNIPAEDRYPVSLSFLFKSSICTNRDRTHVQGTTMATNSLSVTAQIALVNSRETNQAISSTNYMNRLHLQGSGLSESNRLLNQPHTWHTHYQINSFLIQFKMYQCKNSKMYTFLLQCLVQVWLTFLCANFTLQR